VSFTRSLGQTGTPDLAYRWITRNLPVGTKIAIESRVLVLSSDRYPSENLRSLLDRSYDDYVSQEFGYLIASSVMYGRAFAAPQDLRNEYIAYRSLFERSEEVATFAEGPDQPGPTLRIFRIRR
jgi:hypothetical protein